MRAVSASGCTSDHVILEGQPVNYVCDFVFDGAVVFSWTDGAMTRLSGGLSVHIEEHPQGYTCGNSD